MNTIVYGWYNKESPRKNLKRDRLSSCKPLKASKLESDSETEILGRVASSPCQNNAHKRSFPFGPSMPAKRKAVPPPRWIRRVSTHIPHCRNRATQAGSQLATWVRQRHGPRSKQHQQHTPSPQNTSRPKRSNMQRSGLHPSQHRHRHYHRLTFYQHEHTL